MPRIARIKAPEYIYHIMCRSISEVELFRDDDDKNYYLMLIKRYKDKFCCRVYAYCLMGTHLHLFIDPQGFDISKFMHCLNLAYAIYYNKKYNRHGHLFQGRFESKVVSSDQYSLALSAYIHNNPKDVQGYSGREHEYPFSSLGIYLGIRKDTLGLIDIEFIFGLVNIPAREKAIKRYAEFVTRHRDTGSVKSIMDCIPRVVTNVYRDERKLMYRDKKPREVLSIIEHKLDIQVEGYIMLKSRREVSGFRAFCAFVQRSLCSYSYKDICQSIGNISLSAASRLCSEGFRLYSEKQQYKDVFNDILKLTAANY